MHRPSITVLSKLITLSALLASGCAHGLNDPEEDQGSLPLGGATTTVGSSGAGGAKSTGNTTSATSAGNTVASVTSVTSAQATTSTTSGGGTCDASGDCGTCGNCALSGQCQSAVNACNADQNCNALLGCLQNCADQTCADACAAQYPGGQAGYTALITCVICNACPVSCQATTSGVCP